MWKICQKFWDKKVRTENERKISDVAIILFHICQKEFYYEETKGINKHVNMQKSAI